MKKWVWIVVVASLLILILFYNLKKQQFEKVSPKMGPIVEVIYGLGKVKTDQKFEVKVGVLVTIQHVHVKEGEFVKKGQKLVSFESTGSVSTPIDGVVTAVYFVDGEAAFPQVPILRVDSLENKYIEVSLEQEAALRVKKDQKAIVTFENLRGENKIGKVLNLYPRNNEFISHIYVDQLDQQVLPSMTADVAIEVSKKDNALLVPINSIENGRIIVERNGKREKLNIKVGSIDGSWAEVLDGSIKESDLIILKKAK